MLNFLSALKTQNFDKLPPVKDDSNDRHPGLMDVFSHYLNISYYLFPTFGS
jgi:hypothetical protein